MKKTTRIILCAACVLVLAAAVLAAVLVFRHEQDQETAIRELSGQVNALREKRQATAEMSAAAETVSALAERVTRLEVQADRREADYAWFAIGNSITVHAPNEVWWNGIGMAASSEDRDYVHLVAEQLSGMYGKTAVHPLYCYAWETSADRGGKLSMLDPYLDPRLQLITIQLGENAEDLTSFETDFEARIRYVQEKAREDPGHRRFLVQRGPGPDEAGSGEKNRCRIRLPGGDPGQSGIPGGDRRCRI